MKLHCLLKGEINKLRLNILGIPTIQVQKIEHGVDVGLVVGIDQVGRVSPTSLAESRSAHHHVVVVQLVQVFLHVIWSKKLSGHWWRCRVLGRLHLADESGDQRQAYATDYHLISGTHYFISKKSLKKKRAYFLPLKQIIDLNIALN